MGLRALPADQTVIDHTHDDALAFTIALFTFLFDKNRNGESGDARRRPLRKQGIYCRATEVPEK